MSSSGKNSSPEKAASSGKAQRPRDAATLVLVDSSSGEPRLLMGRRRATQVFMPNKVVFPGGRVDEADRTVESANELADVELAKVLLDMKGRPSAARARSMALAAVRETFEETGVIIGRSAAQPLETDTSGWQSFFDEGYLPALAELSLFARAITPPGRPRRYDTRFFCASIDAVVAQTGKFDDELSEITWYSIEETSELDLPPITRVIIEDLGDRLQAGPLGPMSAPIPFYHQRNGTFRRDLLSPQSS